jgi:hypothetical protein
MPQHTALLVVHGIGAQKEGETLAKLAAGLRLIKSASVPDAVADGMTVTIGGREIRLYEVFWADLQKGEEKTRGAFDIQEAMSLSWFPWLNWRRKSYGETRPSTLRLAWWSLVLPVTNFLLMFGYYGTMPLAAFIMGLLGKRGAPDDPNRAVDNVFDEYAGDVVSYVNSAGTAFYTAPGKRPPPAARQMVFNDAMGCFYNKLLDAAGADGCSDIQIVAHSLGTVVTWHALSGFRVEATRKDAAAISAAKSKVSRLYTIGSPLEKIRFFWPRIMPGVRPAGVALQWDNFVSFFDPVSGRIRTYDNLGTVTNHPLLGGGAISAHVVYESSRIFLSTLGEGLSGKKVEVATGTKGRLRTTLQLIGETLATPIVLAIVLVMGAALFVGVAMLLPWLGSFIARIFWEPATYGPIQDKVSLVFLGMMVLTFAIAPRLRAGLAHRLWEKP